MRPNLDSIREYLAYDPATGIFTWRHSPNNRTPVGSRAGTVNKNGYRRISFQKKTYPAHHFAWLVVHGVWPAGRLDHRNGIRHDDRITNLRPATDSQNNRNRRSARGSTSSYLGVAWYSRSSVWRAQIKTNGRIRHLGYFDDERAAARAYDAAAIRLHGEFANLNFPAARAA